MKPDVKIVANDDYVGRDNIISILSFEVPKSHMGIMRHPICSNALPCSLQLLWLMRADIRTCATPNDSGVPEAAVQLGRPI